MTILKKMFLLALLAISTVLMSSSNANNEFHSNNYKLGNITAAEFKAQLGLIAWLDDFDFDAKCSIDSLPQSVKIL